MTDYPPPGPELDALVAEKVMGWTFEEWHFKCDDKSYEHGWYWHGRDKKHQHYFAPSTDIRAAWEVVEIGNGMTLWKFSDTEWACCFQHQNGTHSYTETAPTAPHAICLAALEAKGGE